VASLHNSTARFPQLGAAAQIIAEVNQNPIVTAFSRKSAKTVRENLTKEQKRENHTNFNQDRRTLIRERFEDLEELVLGLKGGGFSKSAVLIMAADRLKELIQENEILQHRLDQLEGR
jgi:hypothetical protein